MNTALTLFSNIIKNPEELAFLAVKVIQARGEGYEKEYQEQINDIVLEIAKKFSEQGAKEEENPTYEDVVHSLARYFHTYRKAGSHQKRELLFKAFWLSFKPELYKQGLMNILWECAEKLEYPEAQLLGKTLKNKDNRILAKFGEKEYSLALRLEKIELIYYYDSLPYGGGKVYKPTWLAEVLRELVTQEDIDTRYIE